MTECLLGFLVLSVVVSLVSSSSLSSVESASSKRGKTWNRPSHTACSTSSAPCDGRAKVPTERRACGFYIWDLPSALLYKCCHNLLKDRIYEGRGGYLFVRYESNSILKLLYPCSRYSPNKCMICGGSYPDHLELWWSKHLYSPYDQYLDNTYNDALTIEEAEGTTKQQRSRRRLSGGARKRTRKSTMVRNRNGRNGDHRSPTNNPFRSTQVQTFTDPPTFGFHKRYVEDVSDLIRNVQDPKQIRELVKKRMSALRPNRNSLMMKVNDVTYVAPNVGGFIDEGKYTRKDAFMDIVSIMVYSCLDTMIGLQHREFEEKKQSNSRTSNQLQ